MTTPSRAIRFYRVISIALAFGEGIIFWMCVQGLADRDLPLLCVERTLFTQGLWFSAIGMLAGIIWFFGTTVSWWLKD